MARSILRPTRLHLATFLLLLLIGNGDLAAQIPSWMSRAEYRSELGGAARSVAEDSSGTIVTATEVGLMSSTDDGATWRRASEYGADYEQLQIGRDGMMFALTMIAGADALVRSTDGGRSWRKLDVEPGYMGLNSIAVAPDGSILVGTAGNGIERSTDGGSTFLSAWSASSGVATPFVFLSSGTVLAGHEHGLLRSTDGGASFLESREGMPNTPVTSFAIDASRGILAGTWTRGLWRSTDDGRSWRRVASLDSLLSVNWVATRDDGVIYVGAELGRGNRLTDFSLYRSDDGGLTWTTVTYSSRVARLRSAHLLRNGEVIATVRDPDEPTELPLMRLSRGSQWSVVGSHLRDHAVSMVVAGDGSVMLAASSVGGVYRSTDDGREWRSSRPRFYGGASAVAIGTRSRYYAISDGSIFRSMDFGASWGMFSEGLPFDSVSALRVMADDTLVALCGGRLFISTSLGARWSPLGLDSSLRVVALGSSSHRCVAITGDGAVRWSDDGGATWASSGELAGDEPGAIHVDDDGTILCGGIAGRLVILRRDGSVARHAAAGETSRVATIARGRNGGRIAFAAGSRVHVLDVATGAIVDASNGLPGSDVLHLAATDDGLVAGLARGGIMHIDERVLAVGPSVVSRDASIGIRPSVADRAVWITPSTKGRSDDLIEVFDALGRVIVRERIGILSAEGAALRLDIDRVPEGMYWARLTGSGYAATGRFIVRHEDAR